MDMPGVKQFPSGVSVSGQLHSHSSILEQVSDPAQATHGLLSLVNRPTRWQAIGTKIGREAFLMPALSKRHSAPNCMT